MKKLLATLIAALALAGCDSNTGTALTNAAKLTVGAESDFVIKVSGTPGAKTTGSVMIVKPDGTSSQKSIEGPLPFEVTARGFMVSASFQKVQDKGELLAVVLKDGKEVNRSDTNAAYGVITLASQ